METNARLEALFKPASVAIIGASRDEGKAGGSFLKSLMRNGFEGSYYAVNPRETEIMGLKAYPSVLDIPGELDLVVITIPAPAMPRVMADCAGKQVKAAIIFSAGFREAGAKGQELEKKLLDAAREGGVRIIGPNCMGVYNPAHGLNTIAAHIDTPREGGHISFMGQSGWASENFIVAGTDRGLRLSKVISCGNQADLTVTDYLGYFGDDPETKFIGAYMEGIPDGKEFLLKAARVSMRKPVVIWKAGSTDAGARAVASHTASMAGTDALWDAAFTQAGIIRAGQFDELVDFAAAFGSPYLPA
ncbi:MAG: CoA-binding protein, partial [Deltaproteobacteria bacterium]|nr:CoA-binding protein [Deltaproteobacteria bacterium]